MAETPPPPRTVRVYDRPPAWKRMLPRVVLTIVAMVVSSVASWWVWSRLF